MTRRGWIVLALVVWLIVLAFRGVSVSALPNHVAAGGVYGPGNDVSPGPLNAANAAGMKFYSTNQPSYPVIPAADVYTPANGTPAVFGTDVGNFWNWVDGDEMVAVVETVRGVNGWNGVNSTTSIDAILTTGVTVQDVGNGTLEPFPTVTLSGSGSTIVASWPKLTDANGNIVSYNLYRSPGPVGPIQTNNTAPTMSRSDTGLADGRYCYSVQVNYRRDNTGGIYSTVGRSESRCRNVSSGGNTLPTAALTAPAVGTCATGGSVLTIGWTMGDGAETPVPNLRVWLNYSTGGLPVPIAAVQDRTGFPSPATYDWTTPTIDNTITILLTVIDEGDGKATDSIASIRIDSTRPTAQITQPVAGATSVPTDLDVKITFSEAMATTATEGAVSFVPAVTGPTFTWTVGNTIVTVRHAVFAPNTQYTLVVGTGARDACTPGLTLQAEYRPTFTTAAGPRLPNAPANLRVTSATAAGIALAWEAPTQYDDQSPLPAGEILRYDVYRAASATGTQTKIGNISATSYTDATAQVGTEYFYWVKTVDIQNRESVLSTSASGRIAAQPFPVDPVWIIVAVVAIILLIVGVLLMRGRKPAAPRPPEAPPPTP